ncbi:MAG: hypothetical protein GY862_06650 [Gammaproteobacteria bacterium]|nr:hypothetical protein [Gammaproteobacteria bacterium]
MKTGNLWLVIVSLVWSLLLFSGISNAQPWLSNGDDIYYDRGNVGIGTNSPAGLLDLTPADTLAVPIIQSSAVTSATQGLNWQPTFTKSSGNVNAFRERPVISPTGALNNVYGFTSSVRFDNSSYGANTCQLFQSTPAFDSGYSGTITDAYYLKANSWQDNTGGAASITNLYGLYIADLTLGTDNNIAVLTEGGDAIFNENGGENDFRVEGDTDANLLFVDASTDAVGIGTNDPYSKLDVNGVITATGGDSSDWNAAYGWGNHSLEGYLKIYTETDPVFTLWDKSAGISIIESQISDLDHFTNADETDQVWTTASSDYYTKTDMQASGDSQLHWANLSDVPPGFADGVDDIGSGGLWTAGTGDDIYLQNGNAGVGTTDVTARLQVTNLDDTQAALLVQQQGEGGPLFLEATGGTSGDKAYSVAQTSDGGYIVAGYTHSYGPSVYNIFLLKYDSSGNLTWAKTTGAGDYRAYSVAQTSDGGYIVAGASHEGMTYDVLLLKYDGSGNLIWAKTAGGTGAEWAHSVAQTSDGGYIVAGYTYSYGAGGNDVFLLKYDNSGALTWAKTTGSSFSDVAESVAQTSDGGYIVAGYTYSYGAGDEDVFLLKYDNNGNLSWAKTTGGSTYDRAYSVAQTSDNGYIVAGYTVSYEAESCDVLLLKYDGSGNLTWAKTAGRVNYADTARSVKQTSDGGYIVAGWAKYGGAQGKYDFLLLKYDDSGNLAWAKTPGGGSRDQAYSVAQTSDNGYIVAGSTWSYGAGSTDVLLMKTDANGDIPGCAACGSVSLTVYSITPDTSSPTPSTSTITPDTRSLTLSTSTPSPETDVVCSADGSVLEDVLVVSNEARVGIGTNSPNSALQVSGYVQLDTVSAAPPAEDCDEAAEEGRMKFDPSSEVFYLCATSGWVTK